MNNFITPDVSVIIPCYNSGIYIKEAVNSVQENCKTCSYEIIITNDGSNDCKTLAALNDLSAQGCILLHQENRGPAAARNVAVKASKAQILFFLDSDNLVKENYIEKGIAVLETNSAIGVVYGKPAFFGENKIPRFNTRAFDFDELLFDNYIDTCSLIRRKVWDDVGGFDEASVLIAHEDWEFWIRVVLKGWKFHFIDECTFDYRISSGSLVSTSTQYERGKVMREYVFKKHLPLFIDKYRFFAGNYFVYQKDKEQPFRSFFKYIHGKFFKHKKKGYSR